MNEQSLAIAETIPLTPKDALEIIDTRNKVFERVLAVAVSATGAADWVDMDGKPYLQGSGAEKVARRFGIRWVVDPIDREDLEDELGKYYVYTALGKFSLGDKETIEAIGICSSRDKFFGKVKGEFKKVQDVDLPNIKKKAYTNCVVNGVTRLLGLRNLTWDELSKYGIKKAGKSAVRYVTETQKVESSNKVQNDAKQASAPYWTSEHNGKSYLFAKMGRHFSSEFLSSHGFRQTSKQDGTYFRDLTQEIVDLVKSEFEAAEKNLKGGSNE